VFECPHTQDLPGEDQTYKAIEAAFADSKHPNLQDPGLKLYKLF
jgi:hypothetical protein